MKGVLIKARMSKKNFLTLLDQIDGHHVFINDSSCPQAPIELQLLVALANLGLSGNGGSVYLIAHMFDVAGEAFLFSHWFEPCLFKLITKLVLCLFGRGKCG